MNPSWCQDRRMNSTGAADCTTVNKAVVQGSKAMRQNRHGRLAMVEEARCHSAQATMVQNTPPSNSYQVLCHLSACVTCGEVDFGRGSRECAKDKIEYCILDLRDGLCSPHTLCIKPTDQDNSRSLLCHGRCLYLQTEHMMTLAPP